jgi:hypothetical protein
MARNARRDRHGRHTPTNVRRYKQHVPTLTSYGTCATCNVAMTKDSMFRNDRHIALIDLVTPTGTDWAMRAANDSTG